MNRIATAVRLALLLGPILVGAQDVAAGFRAPPPSVSARAATAAGGWSVDSPDAAVAWYDLLATLRVPGAGAFPLSAAPRSGTRADPALARALADTRESEVLHFVPLYHPSGDRAALAAALRAAASDVATPSARATLVTAALRGAMSASLRARTLPALADALERVEAPALGVRRLDALRQALGSRYLPALAPWLALERLDDGRLLVVPGIGPEGRVFAATRDRRDNLVAVGSFASDPDAEAPHFAFVRELCYPAVTRAAQAAGLDGSAAALARRTGFAAVRCGADLLTARLPDAAERYRAFWLRQAGVPHSGADARGAFDRAFPKDAALAPHLERALRRLRPSP